MVYAGAGYIRIFNPNKFCSLYLTFMHTTTAAAEAAVLLYQIVLYVVVVGCRYVYADMLYIYVKYRVYNGIIYIRMWLEKGCGVIIKIQKLKGCSIGVRVYL